MFSYSSPIAVATSFLEASTPGLGAAFQAPPWATYADVVLTGSGGGGGSGRQGAANPGTIICGGGGGSGAMASIARYELKALASILGVTLANLWFEADIATPGIGAPSVVTASTNGSLGGNGNMSRLRIRNANNSLNKTLMQAAGGFGGQPGATATTTAIAIVNTYPGTFAGSTGSFGTNGNGGNASGSNSAPSGGGGGAGQSATSWADKVGGAGGQPAGDTWGLIATLAQFNNPRNASTNLPPGMPGGGGQGGDSSILGVATAGGTGFRGGGGGGGGGSGGGNPSGAGANGGSGYLYILWS